MNIKEDLILVTGASRGIGKAIAIEFSKAGFKVLGTATSKDGAEAISKYLQELSCPGMGLVLDVKDPKSAEALFNNIKNQDQQVSVLINNAGITRDNLLLRLSDDDWDEVIQTNLTGVFRLCKLFSRPMIKARHGKIINLTSVVGHMGNPGQTNYSASKGGIISFTKSLAKELGGRGINVNCIAPGFIETDMTEALTNDQKVSILNQIPMGKLGNPENIAKAALFLASSDASYITGSTIHVNGGLLME